jgi:hypothetical protein
MSDDLFRVDVGINGINVGARSCWPSRKTCSVWWWLAGGGVKVVKSCWEGQCCDKVRAPVPIGKAPWHLCKAPVVDHKTVRQVVDCTTMGCRLHWSDIRNLVFGSRSKFVVGASLVQICALWSCPAQDQTEARERQRTTCQECNARIKVRTGERSRETETYTTAMLGW